MPLTSLSIDSSSAILSVASVRFFDRKEDAPEILFQSQQAHSRSDSSCLFAALERAIMSTGQPDAIVIGIGPGSYNGLRASIAAAKAIATARGIPLHAVPSPLGMASDDGAFLAVGDARGGHFWVAHVVRGSLSRDPELISPHDLRERIASEPGLPVLGSAELPGIPGLLISSPDAVRLAITARKQHPFYLRESTPEPIYLKPPHITVSKKTSLA